jgi:hypothetical protein
MTATMEHLNGTALDRPPRATRIEVEDFSPTIDVTFRLDGAAVMVTCEISLTGSVADTFPADLAGAKELDEIGNYEVAAEDWLPEDALPLPSIVWSVVRGIIPDGTPETADVLEYLRKMAESALNETCTDIRRDRHEAQRRRSADPLLARRIAEHAERQAREGDQPSCDIDGDGRLIVQCFNPNSQYEGPWVRES